MARNRARKQSASSIIIQCVTAPIRALIRVKNMYVDSMNDCANMAGYSGDVICPVSRSPTGRLPRSFSSRESEKEIKKRLIRSQTSRGSGGKYCLDGSRSFELSRRSYETGVGRIGKIDEDSPCEFVEDGFGMEVRLLSSRSRSSHSHVLAKLMQQECWSRLVVLSLVLTAYQLRVVLCYGTVVKTLPGFHGDLPFKLETGYVAVGASELFYYFIESEGNPNKDPLLLWYSGGPGCSALNGLIYEIGPLEFNISAYEGGIPPLSYYPYSWTKTASILFVDAPVGTGFSYATDSSAYPTSDTKSAAQTYAFLRKWLMDHPQFLKVQLFIGADSYSGISAPLVVQHVVNGNKAGISPYLNLKGYIVGCPRTDAMINENSKIAFSQRIGLISDELYQATRRSCNATYIDVKPGKWRCFENLELVSVLLKDINKYNILEPKCTWAISEAEPRKLLSLQRLLGANKANGIWSPSGTSDFWCHNLNYSLSDEWANVKAVQKVLNIREHTVQDWKRCNKSLDYDADIPSVLEVQKNLSKYPLQALVYNGDHDLVIPSSGTQEWIKKLNLTVVNKWRPWLVEGQVAGYTVKYSQNGYRLTYATVLGAGHPPQEYKRRECFDMFLRWIHYYPL